MQGGKNFTSIFVLLSGGALAVLSYITLNISGSIDMLLSAIGSPATPAQLKSILEIVIKLAVVLLILLMTLSIYIIYNVTGRSQKLYHPADIVAFIQQNKLLIREVIVFGYSLSFAEPLRFYFQNHPNSMTTVKIICMSKDYIQRNIGRGNQDNCRSSQHSQRAFN